MANYCTFTIAVTGPQDLLDVFKSLVEKNSTREVHGPDEIDPRIVVEYVVHYYPAVWGGEREGFFWAWPRQQDMSKGTASGDSGPVFSESEGCMVIEGECKWNPPLAFLLAASSKFSLLKFDCTSWISDAIFEHWSGQNGHFVEHEWKHCDSQTGEIFEWRKDGQTIDRLTIEDENDHILRRELTESEARFQALFDKGDIDGIRKELGLENSSK